MSEARTAIPADVLAAWVPPEVQRQAAHNAQDAFSRVFRLSLDGNPAAIPAGLAAIGNRLQQWADAGGNATADALRLALLVAALDQWGLAYSQAFDLPAIPGLSELIGGLRNRLDAPAEARFQQQYAAIDGTESSAIDFKVELRRGIHLALWHAMIASEERDEALRILGQLGGMMIALVGFMPQLGWRLVADALALVQIRCLEKGLAGSGLAQETTQGLFAALRQGLTKDSHDRIMAHATQAVLAWQQAQRQVH